MFFIIDILFIVILLLLIFYLLIHFRKLPFISRFEKPSWLSWVLSALLAAISIYLVHYIFKLSIIFVLFLFYSFLIFDFLNLIFKRLIKRESLLKKWSELYHSGILIIIFMIIITLFSYYTAINVVTTQYNLRTNKSIGVPDLKISMISDLHLGTTMNSDKLEKYCRQIQASKPDIVVLDGDMFDEKTSKEDMEAACRLFGKIKSTYGVYYVYGNHDVQRYSSSHYFSKKDIYTDMNSNNIVVLDDEAELVNNQFYIIGRADASFSREAGRKSLPELLKSCDKNKFILLLDHQPLDLKKASEDGVDLQLSGHTHGGQIWPGGLISEIFHINEMNYGYRKIGNYQIIVSSGIGAWSDPLRLGSKSEIVQIRLHSK